MFSILSHKGNAYQNYIEIPSQPVRMPIIKKTKLTDTGGNSSYAQGRDQEDRGSQSVQANGS
jgi:hypothetical protein